MQRTHGRNRVIVAEWSLQSSVIALCAGIYFSIKTSVRRITACKKVYWVQIFQGKSECLLEQKLEGDGSGSEAKRGRKRMQGSLEYIKSVRRKYCFFPPRPFYIYIFSFWEFVFKLWLLLLFPPNIIYKWKVSGPFWYQMRRDSKRMPSSPSSSDSFYLVV